MKCVLPLSHLEEKEAKVQRHELICLWGPWLINSGDTHDPAVLFRTDFNNGSFLSVYQ